MYAKYLNLRNATFLGDSIERLEVILDNMKVKLVRIFDNKMNQYSICLYDGFDFLDNIKSFDGLEFNGYPVHKVDISIGSNGNIDEEVIYFGPSQKVLEDCCVAIFKKFPEEYCYCEDYDSCGNVVEVYRYQEASS